MLCLAVDTSSKYLCVVLSENGKVIAAYNRIKERLHGQLLVPVIEKMMAGQRLSLSKLDCLAVNIGPGSFTGLRIGISAVQGLSFALDIPVIPIASLDLIAADFSDDKKIRSICAIIDAKRKQVYAALFRASGEKIKRQGKYFLGPVDELLKDIHGPVLFCGDGLSLYGRQISEKLGDQAVFSRKKLWYTQPAVFARCCFEYYKKKKYKKAQDIVPMYLYSHTCTVRKKKSDEK